MKVLVLGAGVIGVTSAWYLARAGHEVTVLDRQPAPGMETSFANGGQISVSHAEPWANPGAPGKILRWLGREDAPLLFRRCADRAHPGSSAAPTPRRTTRATRTCSRSGLLLSPWDGPCRFFPRLRSW